MACKCPSVMASSRLLMPLSVLATCARRVDQRTVARLEPSGAVAPPASPSAGLMDTILKFGFPALPRYANPSGDWGSIPLLLSSWSSKAAAHLQHFRPRSRDTVSMPSLLASSRWYGWPGSP